MRRPRPWGRAALGATPGQVGTGQTPEVLAQRPQHHVVGRHPEPSADPRSRRRSHHERLGHETQLAAHDDIFPSGCDTFAVAGDPASCSAQRSAFFARVLAERPSIEPSAETGEHLNHVPTKWLPSGSPMERTIPNLLADAAGAAAEAPWLFFGDAVFTYEEAARRIGSMAAGLADLGVGSGRPRAGPDEQHRRPPLHLAGAHAPRRRARGRQPRLEPGRSAGLVDQAEPRLVLGDGDVDRLLAAGDADPPAVPGPRADDPAVLIPTSGTTGRSKLVTQTQRAYVMAGEGFPWWMELTADDRLMTSLPLFHINAPAYSVLGSVAARAGLVLLPRFSPATFLDSARRYGATEFNAIGAMIEMLMRQTGTARRRRHAAAPRLHRPGADRGPPTGDRAASRPAAGVRLRPVREPLRHHLAPGHPALRNAGSHPPAPDPGGDQRGPGHAGRPARPAG